MNTTFPAMRFFSRKLIKPEDLNSHGTLFGGSVLAWIDEEAAIYVICQLGKSNIATKFMSEIDFVSSAKLGDIIEIGMETDRKSTRLNSSHVAISYAVFCLKKKKAAEE